MELLHEVLRGLGAERGLFAGQLWGNLQKLPASRGPVNLLYPYMHPPSTYCWAVFKALGRCFTHCWGSGAGFCKIGLWSRLQKAKPSARQELGTWQKRNFCSTLRVQVQYKVSTLNHIITYNYETIIHIITIPMETLDSLFLGTLDP